ncbi:methylenetetrahydrofolate reductase [Streptomyces aureus]|uniref:Methylenetetrahydrofolate reductase n=1 Tax=Streptomyces aureus TaxID=193461 RepID=A0ABV4SM42_9ACTN
MREQHRSECHLSRILADSRFEILPFSGVPARTAQELPKNRTVTVTCSPKHGVDRTVEATEFLSGQGYATVPHLAASAVRDRRHLAEIVTRLAAAGVDEAFVVGGDAQTGSGVYTSAQQLLGDLRELDGCPARLGVAGYPEGHPAITEETLLSSLRAKSESASYVVTQMCFDARSVRQWIARLREAGIDLPVVLGAPGSVARRKLVEMSARIGVGASARFLTKNLQSVGKLLTHKTFTPGEFLHQVTEVHELAPHVAGVHFFTFNQVAETERWLAERMASLGRSLGSVGDGDDCACALPA